MGNKLELIWFGKEDEIKIEPRILIEDKEKSNCTNDQNTENMIIHGDNLLALKALESKYAGKVKCIYIDPPYNTGSAFERYDDNLEHSTWLSLMNCRLHSLYTLLRKDGFMFVNLDEQEHAYAKILLDSIFGRHNFIGDMIWKKRKGGGNDSRYLALDHDYILVYAKDASKETHPRKWKTVQSEEYLKRYKEIEVDGRRYYWDTVARDGLQNPIPVSVFCPDGSILSINSQISQATINEGLSNGSVRLTKSKNGWTLHHKVYMGNGKVQRSIVDDVGTNKTASDEMMYLFGDKKAFPYPKPEKLIARILDLSTEPNDLVLDSFLGSGTTCAVAQKMNRRYIGIEMGDHAYTHCKVRLDKVIDGSDQGGISKAVGWQGGGAYKFYELAPSLINKDDFGEFVINKEYDADMLASAVALHEGFTYAPDEHIFWKQSKGNENSYLFVTTRHLNAAYLDSIKSTMEDEEYLIIACKSYENGADKLYPNITVKKIPMMLLERCEFDKENYNLNIINPPVYEDEEEEVGGDE
ncbi:site-specific DNA-methyltransferase [Jonquetella anthropi]|uniref:site-specific DNA-methyltransferase n=1 Tax=Jonquetella anthropi TaxID=428712 RepID=UPI0001B90F96|nr:site-specific DNA-methyltransferase [Jonquetella anthropi]EEX48729.1 DNA (cytosine-5-)-methyltransferase [Jonquetella anthropi E3_33 E1]